ncbi:MAG: glycosyltransferase family 92 protein, partial [Desulfomonilaceae bacterium]
MNFNGPEWCYLGLCAIAKRENEYLKEWVDYHVLVGVEHFVIYYNEEHPIAHRILKEYVDNGVVTVIHWPFKYAQLNVYQHCIDS